MLPELTIEKAFIFRITHRDNIPWVLDNGLHARCSPKQDPDFVNIGNAELIDRRHRWGVPHPPGGVLSDYIPFYFTPLSIMAYNIGTGHNGIRKRNGSEVVILVSSLRKLEEQGVPFLFTDQHAVTADARFSSDLSNLDWIDWDILQRRDFSRDNDDLGKMGRYQAEALVHKYMPLDALLGIVCYDAEQKAYVDGLVETRELELKVIGKRGWYF